MNSFATLWSPPLDLIGTPSLVAFVISGTLFITVHKLQKNRKLGSAFLLIIFPLILFCLALLATDAPFIGVQFVIEKFDLFEMPLAEAFIKPRRFPSADSFLANFIYLTSALMISFNAAKSVINLLRILALFEFLLIGCVIATEGIGIGRILIQD